jgi:hypothetical protein
VKVLPVTIHLLTRKRVRLSISAMLHGCQISAMLHVKDNYFRNVNVSVEGEVEKIRRKITSAMQLKFTGV